MSTAISWNGLTYNMPAVAEASWGAEVSRFLVALPAGALQRSGGDFTLTADVDSGASYGWKAAYFKTRTANAAAAGLVRLAVSDTVSWRNNANGADLPLGVNGSNLVTFNSVALVDISTAQTLTNKTLTAPILTAPVITGALTLTTAAYVVDASDATKRFGWTLSGATTGTTITLISAHTANRSITLPDATTTLVGTDTTQTLSNKTFTAPVLGVATATSINGLTITTSTGTLTIASAKVLTISNTITMTATDGSTAAFGAGGTVAYVANKLSVFASTTSAELAGVISDETGSGSLVFGTAPVLRLPTVVDTSDTTKVLTWQLSGATASRTLTLISSHTNNRSITYPDATTTLVGTDTTQTLTNKTLTSPVMTTPTLGVASATNIICALGAVGTPSHTFTGDLNTGMYSSAADTLDFATGGVRYISVSPTGYITAGASTQNSDGFAHIFQTGNTGASFGGVVLQLKNTDTTTASDDNGCLGLLKGSTTNTTAQILARFWINAGSTGSGMITSNGVDTCAFATFSDARLKNGIEDLEPQLAKINALRPRTFYYKGRKKEGHQLGFIAQEMQEVFPDCVDKASKDGMLAIAGWSKTEARLVMAIKELTARIIDLEKRVPAHVHP